MEALSERGMGKAVGDFVKKDDNDAIVTMVNYQIKDINTCLNSVRFPLDSKVEFWFQFVAQLKSHNLNTQEPKTFGLKHDSF
mgnify:FL=1